MYTSAQLHLCLLAGNSLGLTPCVTAVVIGYFSPDDKVRQEHFSYDAEDPRLNFVEGSEERMLGYLIHHFSFPGSIVMDMSGLEGM